MNDVASPPEKYWHCKVHLNGEKRPAVVNDLTFRDLEHTILMPWRAGRTFTVPGTLVQSSASLKEIKITQTDQPQRHYADQYNNSMRNSNFVDMATDRRLLPLTKGKDWTYDLLFPGPSISHLSRMWRWSNSSADDYLRLLGFWPTVPDLSSRFSLKTNTTSKTCCTRRSGHTSSIRCRKTPCRRSGGMYLT
jgi:hypothetical protein